jgi:hypothetical protein
LKRPANRHGDAKVVGRVHVRGEYFLPRQEDVRRRAGSSRRVAPLFGPESACATPHPSFLFPSRRISNPADIQVDSCAICRAHIMDLCAPGGGAGRGCEACGGGRRARMRLALCARGRSARLRGCGSTLSGMGGSLAPLRIPLRCFSFGAVGPVHLTPTFPRSHPLLSDSSHRFASRGAGIECQASQASATIEDCPIAWGVCSASS